MRGRKPKPSTNRAPESGRPPTPPNLTGAALTEFEQIVTELEVLGVLATVDRAALAMLAELLALKADAYGKVIENGQVIKQPNGWPGPNPFLSNYLKYLPAIRALLAEFGLTPVARAKFKASAGEGVAEDVPFADLDE